MRLRRSGMRGCEGEPCRPANVRQIGMVAAVAGIHKGGRVVGRSSGR